MLRLPKFSAETFGLRKVKSADPLGFMGDVCSPENTRNTSPLPDSLDSFCEEVDKHRKKSFNPSASTLNQARIISKVMEDTFGCKAASELKYMTPAAERDNCDDAEEQIDIKFSVGRRRSISLGSRPPPRIRTPAGKAVILDTIEMTVSDSIASARGDGEEKERFKAMIGSGLL
uniref:Uncharacterized protein n=1 Tax=Plectus sambesii TaxID=2011161 RepID=A0A914UQN6_9BILA